MYKKNARSSINFLILSVLITGIIAGQVHASTISSTTVENCIGNEYGLDCDEKAIVQLSVTYGQETNLEALSVKNIQKDGEPQTLEETFQISITKSQPTMSYPLRYFHTVSYFPYEEVIKVPDVLGCIDDNEAVNPTAGWSYYNKALPGTDDTVLTKIPYSQGFCVSSYLQQLGLYRGEELFDASELEKPYSMAHAVRTGEIFFNGYEMDEYIKDYAVKIEITKGEDVYEFDLTPGEPLYSIQHDDPSYRGDIRLIAELIGDMEDYVGTPELSNYILYIPVSPATHPYVQDYQQNMLLVPREEVSKDGTELDKVGTGSRMFRKLMGNGTNRVTEAGDGLGNQLFHKHNKDLQKLILDENAETEYLVHGKRYFKKTMKFEQGMPQVLEHKIKHLDQSMISITMDQADLKIIKTESVGAINEAYVKKFVSLSENGNMVIEIQNYGDMKSDYVTTIGDCNCNISPAIPAQSRTLEAYEMTRLSFDISTLFNLETTNECLVTLRSTTGRIYDQTPVIFDTEKLLTQYPWELYEKNEASVVGTLSSDPNRVRADVTAPVITLNSPDDAMVIATGSTYAEPGATATDNADGIVTVVIAGDTVDTSVAGVHVVTYDATDSAGNAAKQLTRTVIVRGRRNPPKKIHKKQPKHHRAKNIAG